MNIGAPIYRDPRYRAPIYRGPICRALYIYILGSICRDLYIGIQALYIGSPLYIVALNIGLLYVEALCRALYIGPYIAQYIYICRAICMGALYIGALYIGARIYRGPKYEARIYRGPICRA